MLYVRPETRWKGEANVWSSVVDAGSYRGLRGLPCDSYTSFIRQSLPSTE
jgi:hypothetical protein